MAVVAVTANVTRVAEAEIIPDTGTWGNDGGGGGVADETDVVYQGTRSQSRKVGTSAIGRSYTHGSGIDMDGTPASTAHYIAKIAATNYGILSTRATPALHMKIGSSSANYDTYYLYGSDNYPAKGGFQIIAIAPSVSGYRDATTATAPTRSAILYWSLLGDFTTTSKAENVIIDAIDVGLGLGLVGGDGASTDGVFQDFVDADEGTVGNRWGFVFTEGPVLFVTGQLAIGQTGSGTSTLTVFQDSGVTLVWTNGLVTTGFHRLLVDLATTSTDIDMTNCSLQSQGQENNDGDRGYTTTEDSRPILEVTGTSGAFNMTGCVVDNFASMILNASCSLVDCVISNSGDIDLGTGATLSNATLSGYTGAADTSQLLWDNTNDPNGELDNLTITKGTAAHHAIEFGTTAPLTITVTGWTTSGFNASNAQNDSTFYVARTTGDVTINVIGGTGNFSYKSAGANVTIVLDPVTTLISVKDDQNDPLQNARVLVEASDATGDLPYDVTVTITRSGSTASVSHTSHGMANGDLVAIRFADQPEYNGVFTISNVSANAYDYTVSGTPATPATGTIKATGVVVSGLTDVNGEVSASASYSVDQNVKGVVRKSTASPFFKLFDFNDVVDNVNGLTKSVQMVLDE
jgi:hypothetical protein